MHIDDRISEFIGAIADLVVSLQAGTIRERYLTAVFNILGVENPEGADYVQTHALIRRAHHYHLKKSNNVGTATADNIKAVYTLKDGTPVIR